MDKTVQHVQRIKGVTKPCPASSTGQRHNPLPSQALRIFAPAICPARILPEQVSQMITQNPLDLPDAQNAPFGAPRAASLSAGTGAH